MPEKETQVIYHVGHIGFLWMFLIHRQTHHPAARTLFVINEVYLTHNTEKFVSKFDQTLLQFGIPAVFNENKFSNLGSEEETERKVCAFFDKVLDDHGFDLPLCRVYSGFDVLSSFTAYLTIKKKQFTMYDMGLSVYNDRYHLNSGEHMKHYRRMLEKHRALTWDNPFVTDVIWPAKKPPRISKPSKVIDHVQLMKKLPKTEQRKILSFFNVPSIGRPDFDMIVCSSAWIREVGLSIDDYIKIFAQLADYLLKDTDNLLIKPHPNANYPEEHWKFFFTDDIMVPGHFPSQLLNFVTNFRPRKLLSTGSTGALELSRCEQIDLTPQCLTAHALFHKLFVALSVTRTLGKNVKLNINLIGLRLFCDEFIKALFPDLIECMELPESDAKIIVYIADNIFCKEGYDLSSDIHHNSVVFFLDSTGLQNLPLQNIEYSLPIVIKKTLVKMRPNEKDEIIFAYSKNEEIRDLISSYTQEYGLRRTGMNIRAFSESKGSEGGATVLPKNALGKKITLVSLNEHTAELDADILSSAKIHAEKKRIFVTHDHNYGEFVVFGYSISSGRVIFSSNEDQASNSFFIDSIIPVRYRRYGDEGMYSAISKAYLDGRIVKKNIDKAIKFKRMSLEETGRGKKELAGMLTIRAADSDTREAHQIYSELAGKGDTDAMGMLGRMYRDGKGTKKDLDAAIEWMRKAADGGIGWAKNELTDMLIIRGTKDDIAEAFTVCSGFARTGDAHALGRLGRMYRDGKGIERDNNEAVRLMRAAFYKHAGWTIEFIDMLIIRGTDSDLREAFEMCSELAKKGNAAAMVRLGRSYRDGKGTDQDIGKAAEWMRCAAKNGVKWVAIELFDVLWNIGTPESYSEMISAITPLAEAGDGNASLRLGRAYRDGKGVNSDKEIAAQWYRKAKENGVPWAENELSESDKQANAEI